MNYRFARFGSSHNLTGMSLESLMQEAAKLDDAENRRLSAYLISLRNSREPGHAEKMTRLIDDKDPNNWVTLEGLDRRLGLES